MLRKLVRPSTDNEFMLATVRREVSVEEPTAFISSFCATNNKRQVRSDYTVYMIKVVGRLHSTSEAAIPPKQSLMDPAAFQRIFDAPANELPEFLIYMPLNMIPGYAKL